MAEICKSDVIFLRNVHDMRNNAHFVKARYDSRSD